MEKYLVEILLELVNAIPIDAYQRTMGILLVAEGYTFFGHKTKNLIRLGRCADWFEYSLYAHANMYLMQDTVPLIVLVL